jgi:hypothetical protein
VTPPEAGGPAEPGAPVPTPVPAFAWGARANTSSGVRRSPAARRAAASFPASAPGAAASTPLGKAAQGRHDRAGDG